MIAAAPEPPWEAWYAAIDGAAPDAETASEGRAYVARLYAAMLGRMLPPPDAALDALPYIQMAIAGANPDYRMAQALLDPGALYAIEGNANGADRIGIGLYAPGADGALTLKAYHVVPLVDGCVRVTVGPPGADPVTLELTPDAPMLMLRELYRRGDQPRADLRLRRIGPHGPHIAADASPTAVAQRMAAACAQTGALLHRFLEWTTRFAELPNRVTPLAPDLDRAVQGDPGTCYFSGYFDLANDEYLEIAMPALACQYWMAQATTHWLEPIHGADCNDATAHSDPDGCLRIRIGAAASDQPNWLDTAGRRRGAILIRIVDGTIDGTPVATLRSRQPVSPGLNPA